MPGKPIPAIYFHPDQVEGAGRDLVGRRSAGESFLKGWLRNLPADRIAAVVESAEAEQALAAKLRDLGETRPLDLLRLRGNDDFTTAGTVFFPTPGYQGAAWRRQRFGPQRCSLVGLTHTVSTRRIIQQLHDIVSQPVEPWDAIICTSRAVQSVVKRQFEAETEFFRRRFGATRVPLPHLPVIPLGIETADFAPQDGARERLRAAHGVAEGDVVVMTMGRLSVVEKANPVPLLLALEEAARATGRKLHLWMTGWTAVAEEEALHRLATEGLCRAVSARILDGRDPDLRRNLWAAADIFTLPADSIQETFGLVPVEAMAAGLPVVMPDWDGFRDTVIHGQTGFRVPTRMAPPGAGITLARRFADETDGYMRYLTAVQAQVQVDVPAYAGALATLVADDGMRRSMGQAAMRHARATLDWNAVVPQYLALTEELAAIRGRSPVSTPPLSATALNPVEIDPFDLYRDYPSATVGADTPVMPGRVTTAETLDVLGQMSGHKLYRRQPVAPDLLLAVMQAAGARPGLTIADLARDLGQGGPAIVAAVMLLAKWDVLRLPETGPRP